ncbi:hypothetical protein IKO70_08925 [bacterium]|nr:hypothetical protein [bacterium]
MTMIIAAECNNGVRSCFEVKKISYDPKRGITISTGLDFNKFTEQIIIDPKGDISYIITTVKDVEVTNKVKKCEISGGNLFQKCEDPIFASKTGLFKVEENGIIEHFDNYNSSKGTVLTLKNLYIKLEDAMLDFSKKIVS